MVSFSAENRFFSAVSHPSGYFTEITSGFEGKSVKREAKIPSGKYACKHLLLARTLLKAFLRKSRRT